MVARFIETDIKALEEKLADHKLQKQFDVHATTKLRKWEKLVCSQLPFGDSFTSLTRFRVQQLTGLLVTREVLNIHPA